MPTEKLVAAVLLWLSVTVNLAAEPQTDSQARELGSELVKRMKVDQDARFAFINWEKEQQISDKEFEGLPPEQKAEYEKRAKAVSEIDAENTRWLKEIVEKNGWPTIGMVGKDGARAAWLLVQHADRDVPFQRRCLDLMTALPKSEVSQTDLAYLTDRVLLAEGKKQIYGTQFISVDGRFEPRPIEDEVNLDVRRAEVGLPPMAEYVKAMKEVYGGSTK